MEKAPRVENFDIVQVDRETPSVLHYTSGTTGKPKGALHVHSSIIAQYLTTKWVLDLRPDDIYWCTADPGWVTGTSYGIIGPWACGVTQVVLDAGFGADNVVRLHRSRHQGHGLVLGAHRHPAADEGRDGAGQEARPLLPAAPLQRGRAAERRGGDLVARRPSASRSTTPTGRPRPVPS